ncbi:MAG: hypothetical protein ACRCXY_11480 [Fusobacteriaceae bacterium]
MKEYEGLDNASSLADRLASMDTASNRYLNEGGYVRQSPQEVKNFEN